MPEEKYIEKKMQSFDHFLFTMTSLSANKSKKTILLDDEKNLKA